jgi:hypothetical protein
VLAAFFLLAACTEPGPGHDTGGSTEGRGSGTVRRGTAAESESRVSPPRELVLRPTADAQWQVREERAARLLADWLGTPSNRARGLTIGVMDGQESEVFGRIRAVRADDGGNIYVLDDQSLRTSRGVAGRAGGGPGGAASVGGASCDHETSTMPQRSLVPTPVSRIEIEDDRAT